ncbi:hypothetical protein [Lewinella sp. JB7]|uniref:hypothetical protein n=1 Tax=Lewinella sp. JB7 TaxID=2962887 RepID=UPI0020C9C27F|nr:hypothetical protein [Lewinella sp. JB7]MCP9237621.1 hypothetical protein [Lewinella sp. JB7]
MFSNNYFTHTSLLPFRPVIARSFGKLVFIPILLLLGLPGLQAQNKTFNEAGKVVIDVRQPSPRLVNFRHGTRIDSVYGLQDGAYTTTIEGTSILRVPAENIGQVILYVRLIGSADTSIFVDNPKLKGSITILPVSGGKEVEAARAVYHFGGADTYRQIYYLSQTIGVDEVVVTFESMAGFFILSRAEIIPYTPYGIDNIRNQQQYDSQLSSKPDRYATLRAGYTEELKRIESYHKVLRELIGREESAGLARLKTQGYNPFGSPEFQQYFNQLLEKADAAERAELTQVRRDISQFNFEEIALTVDNLLLGGKFSTLIGLMGNAFSGGMSLADSRGRTQNIMELNGTHYFRDDRGTKIKLEAIEDEEVLRRIEELSTKNKQFQQYISILQQFMGQDLDLQNKINQDILVARTLMGELEKVQWQLLDDITDRPRKEFIADNTINYTASYDAIVQDFPDLNAASLDFLDQQEVRMQSIRSELRDIRTKYQRLLGNLKTHYDNLYQDYPQDRLAAFQSLNLLPVSLGESWNDNQRQIIARYKESSLLHMLNGALSGQ